MPVIDDQFCDKEKVSSVVFCTGKFYYDMAQRREENGRNDVALVRLEQLFHYLKMKSKQSSRPTQMQRITCGLRRTSQYGGMELYADEF